MKKVAIVFLGIIILLYASFLVYRKIDVEQNTRRIGRIKSEVTSYLNMKNGMNENKYDLNVEYYFQRKLFGYNPFVVKVIFKDEENVIYYYNYKNGEINQSGISPMKGKDDKNFMHEEKE